MEIWMFNNVGRCAAVIRGARALSSSSPPPLLLLSLREERIEGLQ